MIKKYSKFLEIIPITNEQTSRIPDHSSIPAKVLLGNSCSSKVPLRDINFKLRSIGNDVTDNAGPSEPF
jgi:hypothetical protein